MDKTLTEVSETLMELGSWQTIKFKRKDGTSVDLLPLLLAAKTELEDSAQKTRNAIQGIEAGTSAQAAEPLLRLMCGVNPQSTKEQIDSGVAMLHDTPGAGLSTASFVALILGTNPHTGHTKNSIAALQLLEDEAWESLNALHPHLLVFRESLTSILKQTRQIYTILGDNSDHIEQLLGNT